MFLYTMLGAEQIFPLEPCEMKTKKLENDFFECYEQGGKTYLSRVISTEPKKFLDKRYTIGGEFLC